MTGSDREREAETLAAFLRTIPSKRETETFGQYDRRRARAVLASDWLAEHDKAIADEAAAEANAVRDRKFGNLRWLEGHEQGLKDADARYAALVYKVRALADEWEGYGHGRYNIHLEERLPCSACDLLAGLRALLAEHDKAIADEAAAEAHRCQVGGDGWSAARGRGSVGGDQ